MNHFFSLNNVPQVDFEGVQDFFFGKSDDGRIEALLTLLLGRDIFVRGPTCQGAGQIVRQLIANVICYYCLVYI